MSLTKEETIEIQEAARYQTQKRARDAEAELEYKQTVATKIAASKQSEPEVVADKKGK